MPAIEETAISCGVRQLRGLYSPSHLLLKCVMTAYKQTAYRQGRSNGFAQFIFSDADIFGNGTRFAKYLQKNFPKIEIVTLGAKNSPSTGRNITTWIVNIPHVKFKAHRFYNDVARPR